MTSSKDYKPPPPPPPPSSNTSSSSSTSKDTSKDTSTSSSSTDTTKTDTSKTDTLTPTPGKKGTATVFAPPPPPSSIGPPTHLTPPSGPTGSQNPSDPSYIARQEQAKQNATQYYKERGISNPTSEQLTQKANEYAKSLQQNAGLQPGTLEFNNAISQYLAANNLILGPRETPQGQAPPEESPKDNYGYTGNVKVSDVVKKGFTKGTSDILSADLGGIITERPSTPSKSQQDIITQQELKQTFPELVGALSKGSEERKGIDVKLTEGTGETQSALNMAASNAFDLATSRYGPNYFGTKGNQAVGSLAGKKAIQNPFGAGMILVPEKILPVDTLSEAYRSSRGPSTAKPNPTTPPPAKLETASDIVTSLASQGNKEVTLYDLATGAKLGSVKANQSGIDVINEIIKNKEIQIGGTISPEQRSTIRTSNQNFEAYIKTYSRQGATIDLISGGKVIGSVSGPSALRQTVILERDYPDLQAQVRTSTTKESKDLVTSLIQEAKSTGAKTIDLYEVTSSIAPGLVATKSHPLEHVPVEKAQTELPKLIEKYSNNPNVQYGVTPVAYQSNAPIGTGLEFNFLEFLGQPLEKPQDPLTAFLVNTGIGIGGQLASLPYSFGKDIEAARKNPQVLLQPLRTKENPYTLEPAIQAFTEKNTFANPVETGLTGLFAGKGISEFKSEYGPVYDIPYLGLTAITYGIGLKGIVPIGLSKIPLAVGKGGEVENVYTGIRLGYEGKYSKFLIGKVSGGKILFGMPNPKELPFESMQNVIERYGPEQFSSGKPIVNKYLTSPEVLNRLVEVGQITPEQKAAIEIARKTVPKLEEGLIIQREDFGSKPLLNVNKEQAEIIFKGSPASGEITGHGSLVQTTLFPETPIKIEAEPLTFGQYEKSFTEKLLNPKVTPPSIVPSELLPKEENPGGGLFYMNQKGERIDRVFAGQGPSDYAITTASIKRLEEESKLSVEEKVAKRLGIPAIGRVPVDVDIIGLTSKQALEHNIYKVNELVGNKSLEAGQFFETKIIFGEMGEVSNVELYVNRYDLNKPLQIEEYFVGFKGKPLEKNPELIKNVIETAREEKNAFYHGTTKENAEKIIKEGFNFEIDKENGIFLTRDIEEAKFYAIRSAYISGKGNVETSIIKVNIKTLPNLLKIGKFTEKAPGEFQLYSKGPIKSIEIIQGKPQSFLSGETENLEFHHITETEGILLTQAEHAGIEVLQGNIIEAPKIKGAKGALEYFGERKEITPKYKNALVQLQKNPEKRKELSDILIRAANKIKSQKVVNAEPIETHKLVEYSDLNKEQLKNYPNLTKDYSFSVRLPTETIKLKSIKLEHPLKQIGRKYASSFEYHGAKDIRAASGRAPKDPYDVYSISKQIGQNYIKMGEAGVKRFGFQNKRLIAKGKDIIKDMETYRKLTEPNLKGGRNQPVTFNEVPVGVDNIVKIKHNIKPNLDETMAIGKYKNEPLSKEELGILKERIARSASGRGNYVGGSYAIELQMGNKFRQTKDIDILLESVNKNKLDNAAVRAEGAILKKIVKDYYYETGRNPKNIIQTAILYKGGKGKLLFTIRDITGETAEPVVDILAKGKSSNPKRASDKIINYNGIRVKKANQVIRDKRNIIRLAEKSNYSRYKHGIYKYKLEKAKADVEQYEKAERLKAQEAYTLEFTSTRNVSINKSISPRIKIPPIISSTTTNQKNKREKSSPPSLIREESPIYNNKYVLNKSSFKSTSRPSSRPISIKGYPSPKSPSSPLSPSPSPSSISSLTSPSKSITSPSIPSKPSTIISKSPPSPRSPSNTSPSSPSSVSSLTSPSNYKSPLSPSPSPSTTPPIFPPSNPPPQKLLFFDILNKTTLGKPPSKKERADYIGNASESNIEGLYNRPETIYGIKRTSKLARQDWSRVSKGFGNLSKQSSKKFSEKRQSIYRESKKKTGSFLRNRSWTL